MNHETMRLLEQQFDTAFAAPDGIQKLRELILTLAMQGKLVPQDPNDQPASELLKAIEAEKKRLVKEGKIKQSKPLPEITPEEIPHDLPKEWEWVRLGNYMLKITDGTHHSPINTERGDFLYISAKNIKDDGVLLQNASYVTKEIHEDIFRDAILNTKISCTSRMALQQVLLLSIIWKSHFRCFQVLPYLGSQNKLIITTYYLL